jgi:PHD/YefM family antitoxin component YafN of YafNO toxin-antitoxin module
VGKGAQQPLVRALMAAEGLESIEATLELLADPAAQQRIAQSQQEIAQGEGLTLDQAEEALAERFGNR